MENRFRTSPPPLREAKTSNVVILKLKFVFCVVVAKRKLKDISF